MFNGIQRRKLLEDNLRECIEMSKTVLGIVLSDAEVDVIDNNYFFRTKDFTVETDCNYNSVGIIGNGYYVTLSQTEANMIIPILHHIMFTDKVLK